MTELPLPIRDVLDVPLDEASVRRMWGRIEAAPARPRMLRRAAWIAAPCVVALLIAVAAAVLIRSSASPEALSFADGAPFEAIESAEEGIEAHLSDGSSLAIAPHTALVTLENEPRHLALLFDKGRALFSVKPHGPRRWSIDCGLAVVEVIGTRFVLDRGPSRLGVKVEEGVVLVRGARVPGHVRRLIRGEALEVFEAVSPPADDRGALRPSGAERAQAASTPGVLRTRISAALSARNGDPSRPKRTEPAPVLAAESPPRVLESRSAGGRSLEPSRQKEAAPPEDLLARADAARLGGDDREAARLLERFLEKKAGALDAPAAAFTLGRLRLERLGDPQGAVDAFRRAIALGLPNALAEDCAAYLAEAWSRSGDPSAARAAAKIYLDRFPEGRHAERMRALVE